jgi:hypothetical protein
MDDKGHRRTMKIKLALCMWINRVIFNHENTQDGNRFASENITIAAEIN